MLLKCLLFALMAVCLTEGYHVTTKTADMDFLHKQKKIYDLFLYVNQNVLIDAEYFTIGRGYDIFNNAEGYTNKEAFQDFVTFYKFGKLQHDAIYTTFHEEHRDEMVYLYRLFYFAKDFQTFYKTACWARIHANPGVFVNAFTAAVFYRDDTKYIRIPAIYEIFPNMFFNSKVLYDAQHLKMSRGINYHGYDIDMKRSTSLENFETFYVYANYTNTCLNPTYDYEYKMGYFTEDVSLNAYYYYFRMMFPFWMDLKDYNVPKDIRGDFYYYYHQQLMARYYLERFSNGFGEIEGFTWDNFKMPAFHSNIVFSNGVAMPRRDYWAAVPGYKYKYLEEISNFEVRILQAIDSGFIYDEFGKQISIYNADGLNYLANIIEGNCNSYNLKYYGAFDLLARDILGMEVNYKCKNYFVPSSLQFFSTSLRDPAFYRLYNRITYFFQRYKSHLKRYTQNELDFPGVRFESVEFDKLYTFFDTKQYTINNAVSVDSFKDGKSFYVKANQYRLNYKPFTYKFTINSDKDTKSFVKIFLGPAVEEEFFDDYTYFRHYYKYFVALDEFEVNLKSGINNFERLSTESAFTKGDLMSSDYFYKKLQKAIEGNEPFTYNDRFYGFPEHLYLPKGSFEGKKFKFFFYVSPYEETKTFELPIFGKYFFTGKSFGYPLDRPMNPFFFNLQNIYFKDAFIYHMKDYDSKYTHQY